MWKRDALQVSFIAVANWFRTVHENELLNDLVTEALEASLCTANERPSLMSRRMAEREPGMSKPFCPWSSSETAWSSWEKAI